MQSRVCYRCTGRVAHDPLAVMCNGTGYGLEGQEGDDWRLQLDSWLDH